MTGEPVVFMRDTIMVNNDLRTRLHCLCGGEVAGVTVVLAARRVIHQLEDYRTPAGIRLTAGGS
jgi:hypothetical protein